MNPKFRFLFFLTMILSASLLTACGDEAASDESGNSTTPKEETQPDPNTVFDNFKTLFFEEKLPYTLAYDHVPSGNSLSEEIQANFIKRKGDIFPISRFAMGGDYLGFITAENPDGTDFVYYLNVFSQDGQLTDFGIVAGPKGEEAMDAIFTADGAWAVTTRPRAEDTGEAIGEGTVTNFALDTKGKIVEK